MKKYFVVGVVAFALMITTAYALNDSSNNSINESTAYNQNCPYYDESTHTHNCPNNKNGNCPNNYSGNRYGRQGGCHRHHP